MMQYIFTEKMLFNKIELMLVKHYLCIVFDDYIVLYRLFLYLYSIFHIVSIVRKNNS